MNKKGHVLNAALLSIGLGYVLEPSGDVPTFVAIAELSVPIVLGALFPDVDTAFGKHRKTLHNFLVLGIFVAFPILFENLYFVWVGILTHYVLDLFGSRRGLAFFYPYKKEYSLPFGVTTSSKWADLVTVLITLAEVALFALVHYFVVPLDGGLDAVTALFGF
ncbi:hypothetical protein AUR64_08865 [Haloprofundus marisrubri]|uniref:Metal-dependent hydrolase n=1 Tax=Haloprofundus marisrubri TaxID=1514971 RepID=A0A0W1R8I4_9EURY|nr:metal-dependent hydrolase [Haloprofundus marisrubri]KTG09740.1 hypothetical protein AUR64_08865 [Haloprofundus marisrubri]